MLTLFDPGNVGDQPKLMQLVHSMEYRTALGKLEYNCWSYEIDGEYTRTCFTPIRLYMNLSVSNCVRAEISLIRFHFQLSDLANENELRTAYWLFNKTVCMHFHTSLLKIWCQCCQCQLALQEILIIRRKKKILIIRRKKKNRILKGIQIWTRY